MTFNVIKFFILLYLKHSLVPRDTTLIYTLPGHLNTCQCQMLTVCLWIIIMKPLIHFSLLSVIHQALKAQCCLGSRPIPGKGGFLDASATSLGLSSESQLLHGWPWSSWPHSLSWAFPYSWDQMPLMIQILGTWHVLFLGKLIICLVPQIL